MHSFELIICELLPLDLIDSFVADDVIFYFIILEWNWITLDLITNLISIKSIQSKLHVLKIVKKIVISNFTSGQTNLVQSSVE